MELTLKRHRQTTAALGQGLLRLPVSSISAPAEILSPYFQRSSLQKIGTGRDIHLSLANMNITKAAIGSLFFSIGSSVKVGVAFLDADGNTVDVQVLPLPLQAYNTHNAINAAINTVVIDYVTSQGGSIGASDILSVY